jgi:hypothetical protein
MARSNQRKGGTDDIERGNVGTGDQDNFDVHPTDKVAVGAGQPRSDTRSAPKAPDKKDQGRSGSR